LEEDLKENENELVHLKALQSTYDTYVRLVKHEIPKLEVEMKTAEAKLAEANKGIDQVHPLCPSSSCSLIPAHRHGGPDQS